MKKRFKKLKWTLEMLKDESLKYSTRNEFSKKSNSAYVISWNRGILDEVCSHMPKHVDQSGENGSFFKWTKNKLFKEASKYATRTDFLNNSSGAYDSARNLDILDEVCSHMGKSRNVSSQENTLFNLIKEKYSSTKKLRVSKVFIKDKPHIKGFEIDILVPELNRGIEFDGKYYHSFQKMRSDRRKKLWPDEDIRNYHRIKDEYFLSKGIEILHIKEEDWIKDSGKCVSMCFEFLNGVKYG